jgi:hypothetical protein
MFANIGEKLPGAMGKPGIPPPIIPFMVKFCRLKPRGVPLLDWPLEGGK